MFSSPLMLLCLPSPQLTSLQNFPPLYLFLFLIFHLNHFFIFSSFFFTFLKLPFFLTPHHLSFTSLLPRFLSSTAFIFFLTAPSPSSTSLASMCFSRTFTYLPRCHVWWSVVLVSLFTMRLRPLQDGFTFWYKDDHGAQRINPNNLVAPLAPLKF